MTLLIVDDEARIRDLIRKYAAFEGYNVEEASNGMEAIEKCRQGFIERLRSVFFAFIGELFRTFAQVNIVDRGCLLYTSRCV